MKPKTRTENFLLTQINQEDIGDMQFRQNRDAQIDLEIIDYAQHVLDQEKLEAEISKNGKFWKVDSIKVIKNESKLTDDEHNGLMGEAFNAAKGLANRP